MEILDYFNLILNTRGYIINLSDQALQTIGGIL